MEYNETQIYINVTEKVNGHIWPNVRELTEYKVGEAINRYSLIVLCAIGFICNPLSFLVNRQRMRVSSPHYYMTHLAVWDLAFILIRTFYHYRHQLNVNIGFFGCKFFNFSHAFSSQYSAWILVAMTFERLVAVRCPFKMADNSAIQRAKSTTAFMAVVFVNVNLHYFWTMEARTERAHETCRFKSQFEQFDHVWKWVDFALYSLIPLITIVILNTLILYNLKRRQRKKMLLTNRPRDQTRMTSQQKTQLQITAMLLAVSTSFAVLTSPLCVYDIVRTSIKNPMSLSALQLATLKLLASIFYCLGDLQHCINFILYFLTGQTFRKELLEFYRKKCVQRKGIGHTLSRSRRR